MISSKKSKMNGSRLYTTSTMLASFRRQPVEARADEESREVHSDHVQKQKAGYFVPNYK
jgi:hypothetical protein